MEIEKFQKDLKFLPLNNLNKNAEILLFDFCDIKILREKYGVLGVLMGTLPLYPQQNYFLSIPLKLMLWEVIWIVENSSCKLIDYGSYKKKFYSLKTDYTTNKNNFIYLQKTKHKILQDQENKDLKDLNNPNVVVTFNDEKVNYDLLDEFEISLLKYLKIKLQKLKNGDEKLRIQDVISRYQTYKFFKQQNYFLSGGLNFGSNLIVYPDEPLKFHSQFIVKFDTIDLNELIISARLATSVRKSLVIIDDINEFYDNISDDSNLEKNNEMILEKLFENPKKQVFCIEWAGFG